MPELNTGTCSPHKYYDCGQVNQHGEIQMIRIICILFFFFLNNAEASGWTGNHLLTNCSAFVSVLNGDKGRDNVDRTGLCIGYLNGIRDGVILMNTLASNQHRKNDYYAICFPNNVSMGQSARILVKFLQERPEDLHIDAGALYYAALLNAFPCKN